MNNLTPAAIAHVTAQIRARYYGQRILILEEGEKYPYNVGILIDHRTGYLSLRGIESLNIDEIEKIWVILGYDRWYVEQYEEDCRRQAQRSLRENTFPVDVYFLLLSLGIALPQSVMLPDGEFITLKREQQIELRIIKIR